MPEEIWGAVFCFFRIAPWLFLVPFFGYTQIPARIRGLTAALLSIAVASSVKVPPLPENFLEWIPMMLPEMIIGSFLGLFIRIILMAVDLVGFLFGFHLNLSNASIFDPSLGMQSTLMSTFLSLGAITLLFEANVHHILLRGLVSSYTWLPAKHYLGDMMHFLLRCMASSLELGVRLAVPVMLLGTIFYIVLGVFSRIMPGLHVFFVVMPAQILISFLIIVITITTLFHLFCIYVDETLAKIM